MRQGGYQHYYWQLKAILLRYLTKPMRLNLTAIALLYGMGIFIYFILPSEPPLLLGFAAGVLIVIASIVSYHRAYPALHFVKSYLLLCLIPLLGILVASAHTFWLQAQKSPVLFENSNLEGMVLRGEDGLRYSDIMLRSDGKLWRVRLQEKASPMPGLIIAVRVKPLQSQIPALRRYNFFGQIHSYAIALEPYEIITFSSKVASENLGLSVKLARLRLRISRQIESGNQAIDGIGRALLVGMKRTIPKEELEQVRIAGLGHILAISGLHFGIFAFGVFSLIRGILAAIPFLAQRYHIKKIAAIFAIFAGLGYLSLSGGAVSAERAFVMMLLICLAIMHDERIFARNLLALAAILLLSFAPHILLSASFQMSFAAVLGLVSFFTMLKYHSRYYHQPKIYRFVLAIIFSTLIASLAVAPFTLLHFGYISIYGIFANLPSVPLLGLWVMPWGALCLFLMPFGWHDFPLAMMNLGIGWIIDIAHFISRLPHSAISTIPPPSGVLFCLIIGGLLLALTWHRMVTILALFCLSAGIILFITAPKPSIILTGWDYGFLTKQGYFFTASLPRGNRRKQIMRYIQEEDIFYLHRKNDFNSDIYPDNYHCNSLFCKLDIKGRAIIIADIPEGVTAGCGKSDLLITPYVMPSPCMDGTIFISGDMVRKHGGQYVFISPLRGISLKEIYPSSGRIWQQ